MYDDLVLGQANLLSSGYKLLTSVTPAEQRWAYGIVHDPSTTYGDTFEASFNGQLIVAHVEHHTWTTDAAGNHIPGQYKGVTLYKSAGASNIPVVAATSGVKLMEAVVVGSALFGVAFTVGKSYFEHVNAKRAHEAPIREKVRKRLLKSGAVANPIEMSTKDLAALRWVNQANGVRYLPKKLAKRLIDYGFVRIDDSAPAFKGEHAVRITGSGYDELERHKML